MVVALSQKNNRALKLFCFLSAGVRPTAAERAGEALRLYGDSVLRTAFFYLHSLPDAEDIVQDTMLQYIKTDPLFENARHEKAWLLRVAINLSKNKLKYLAVRRTDELTDSLSSEPREDLAFVWEAVKRLPQEQGEAIHLFYQEGLSTAEIARLIGKKDATVRSLLFRARAGLRDILGKEYDFYD